MRATVFIGSAFVAKYPNGGGNYWVPLQYLLGFRDLGVDAFWLEILEATGDPATDRIFIESFLCRANELRIAPWTTLAFFPRGVGHPDDRILHGLGEVEVAARGRDALLLNLVGSLNADLRAGFARTVLFDLDPGLFQIWAAEWGMGVGEHDVHLTLGHHLGAPDSPVPLGDVTWHRTWPAVHLPSWPKQATPATRYTTVTQWWGDAGAVLDGRCYDCSKRSSFLEYVDRPARTRARLELAANIHPLERDEIQRLEAHGWRVVPPEVVARTPQDYRRYIQVSRGEFSCAKPAYVQLRPGWLSDRTVCYLASGRPCVVQDTGQSHHLPQAPGLQCFATIDEAAAALERVERDYAAAAASARTLAEELFSTAVILPRILEISGL